jgi:hypothetical protein
VIVSYDGRYKKRHDVLKTLSKGVLRAILILKYKTILNIKYNAKNRLK